MSLDARLRAVAALVPPCNSLCDIGSDHGKLPAYLLEKGVIKSAVVTDISEPSLNKARELFRAKGMEATFLVTDGLKGVPETDVCVIAGMGGNEMKGIFERGYLPERLVLQPMRDAAMLRQYLVENGRMLTVDRTVYCRGQFYSVIYAEVGDDTLTRAEMLFGKTNLSEPTQDFLRYLTEEQAKNEQILSKIPEGHPDRAFTEEYGIAVSYMLVRVQSKLNPES